MMCGGRTLGAAGSVHNRIWALLDATRAAQSTGFCARAKRCVAGGGGKWAGGGPTRKDIIPRAEPKKNRARHTQFFVHAAVCSRFFRLLCCSNFFAFFSLRQKFKSNIVAQAEIIRAAPPSQPVKSF